MTDDNIREPTTTIHDDALQAAYRATANERTPAHLDQIVLRNARQEVRRYAGPHWLQAWRQPVAILATICLAVVLLLEFDDSSVLDQASRTASPFAEEAAESATHMQQIGRLVEHRSLGSSPVVQPSVVETPPSPCAGRSDDSAGALDTWLECIAEKRERGLYTEADAEMDSLLLVYPDAALN